jgi:hypothetical protein
MTEWWMGIPPAESTVACGPDPHRVRWQDGRLTAVDHADPDAEAVLAALGGDEPACLTLLRHWAAHADDPRVLTLAGRHPGDTLGLGPSDAEQVRAIVHQDAVGAVPILSTGGHGRPGPGRAALHHLGLIELLALDAAVGRRLQSEVARSLAERATDADLVVLEAATVGRLLPIARRWSGAARPVEITLGDAPSVEVEGRAVRVTVGRNWLAGIWGRYLSVVDHFLVLDVHRIVDVRAEVTAVAEPGGERVRLTLRGPAPWHVARRHDDPF